MSADVKSAYLSGLVESEALLWGHDVAEGYHGAAANAMDQQWANIIWPVLVKHKIDLSRTIDFACGYGRNARKLRLAGARHLTLIDVNAENLEYCRKAFSTSTGVDFVQNNGYDLSILKSGDYSHFYTFDAMVHFDAEIVIAYIAEFARVLAKGGTAFVHHSNFSSSPGSDFRNNPHWRNFMSANLFSHVSQQHGFEIMEQKLISWGNIPDLDCLTLMKKK